MTETGEHVATSNPDDAFYRFKIGLLVSHPTVDLGPILAPLGIKPLYSRIAGTPRLGVDDRPLSGTFRFSFWTWSELVRGERHFMTYVTRLVDRLEPHAALLHDLVASGGSVAVNVALPGGNNIGSELPFREMGRLAVLEIDLGIEVFPHIGNFA